MAGKIGFTIGGAIDAGEEETVAGLLGCCVNVVFVVV